MPEVKIENCPFCLLKGIESECEVNQFQYGGFKDSPIASCPKCGYASPHLDDNMNPHNQLSLAVRNSIWTRFVEGDEETYPNPQYERQPIEVTNGDGNWRADWWYSNETGFNTHRYNVKAWRIPIPYKEKE